MGLWDITKDQAWSWAERLIASLIRVTQDAKHPTSIAKAMEIILTDFGRPKLLVNKIAAIIQKGNVADLDVDVWDRAI